MTLAQVVSCKFCESSKNTLLTENLRATASVFQCATTAANACDNKKINVF